MEQKSLQDNIDRFNEAWNKFLATLVKELGIIKFSNWIGSKMNKS